MFPDAPLKISLTASVDVRVERRGGEDVTRRDRIDSTRDDSPLTAAPDAVVIDTSDLTIDEVVDRITAEATRRGLGVT